MTTAEIREKLHDLIDTADDKHVKAVYSIFKDEMAEKYDPWEDEEFVIEMDQRVKDVESGKTKGVSWEEVKRKARLRLATKHKEVGHQADKNKKMDLMKQAASDPLFLADKKEINDDFQAVNTENI
jgi:hypothetical protein